MPHLETGIPKPSERVVVLSIDGSTIVQSVPAQVGVVRIGAAVIKVDVGGELDWKSRRASRPAKPSDGVRRGLPPSS